MPPKEIPMLTTLCLENVAANIIRHGWNFSQMQPECESYNAYKLVQFLHSDDITKELKHMYLSDEKNIPLNYDYAYAQEIVTPIDHFSELTTFLFRGRMTDNSLFLWPSLKFLFNEFTKKVSLRFPLRFPNVESVPELFFDAWSLCTKIEHLSLHFGSFPEDRLLNFPNWTSLMELDLLFSCCSDSIIRHAFKNSPKLQVLKASGRDITSQSLFFLCRESHENYTERFRFCKSDGMCCNMGKKLKKLVLYGTEITSSGISCALQHLPLIEEFLEGPLKGNEIQHLVTRGIWKLKKACKLYERPCPTLMFTTMVCDGYAVRNLLNETQECCPFLKTEVYCSEYQLCYRYTATTSSLALTNPSNNLILGFNHIFSFLQDFKVKDFTIMGCCRFGISYRSNPPVHLPSLLPSAKDLEHLCLLDLAPKAFLTFPLFRCVTRLLCEAVNLKTVTLQSGFVQSLMLAMNKNKFKSLEVISLYDTDLWCVSFKSLIRSGTNLSRITYFNCSNAEGFVADHKRFARKYNFDLDICVGEISLCHGTSIKFNLI